MDYPKSVPGVGLVGGKFVDENTATGQQGSLIPSVWGNAVTEEISNVIKDAGDVPAEGDLSQLQKAIRKIVALVWPKASDVEVAAGVVDDKVVTPKKLRLGFQFVANESSGLFAMPTWLGGFIFQWGFVVTGSNGQAKFTYQTAFPTKILGFTSAYSDVTTSVNDRVYAQGVGTVTNATGYVSTASGPGIPGAGVRFIVLGH